MLLIWKDSGRFVLYMMLEIRIPDTVNGFLEFDTFSVKS